MPQIAPPQPPAGYDWSPQPAPTHGGARVAPDQHVLVIPGYQWPAAPEHCTYDGPQLWIGDSPVTQALCCPRCGLDVT
ncbi:hypothetical protein ACIQU6_30575 [Streptomyces sp. NPDC090442]|uniref:hypothetical protein n=1 Tax=Streptomyces sp. NPDC090442 TaxID=3365962 RepID=UPI0038142FB0